MLHKHFKYIFTLVMLFIFSLSSDCQELKQFFNQSHTFFETYVHSSGTVDYKAIRENYEDLRQLTELLQNADLNKADEKTKKAFWINAYNITAIKSIISRYPIGSSEFIVGFFDKIKHSIAGKRVTLNDLEKKYLLAAHPDARLHFVLVCVAKGCPPLANYAFVPDLLDQQLDERTQLAANDPKFIRVTDIVKRIYVSELFNWYGKDFKREGGVIPFLNKFRTTQIPTDYIIKYYHYDWRLNDSNKSLGSNQLYRATALYSKGAYEIKMFNNLYTQQSLDGFPDFNSQSSYFSSFIQVLFGSNKKYNLGFDVVYKSFIENDLPSQSPFNTLRFERFGEQTQFTFHDDTLMTRTRSGLGWIAPKIKFIPLQQFPTFAVQQSIFVPIDGNVENNFVWFTQLFYDRMIGQRTSIFVEAHLWTTIKQDFSSAYYSPNLKTFISYFPTNRFTIYGMAGITELGAGMKYFLTPNLEAEVLYTKYLPHAFNDGRRAATYNIGFRYFR